MTWEAWVAIGALVLAGCAVVIAVVVLRRLRELRLKVAADAAAAEGDASDAEPAEPRLVAFIANPSKPDVAAARGEILRATAEIGLTTPLWLETTVEDPGVGQAREAVRRGADVVVVVGGDGTVRAVAEALTGTKVAMGIVPVGTGNLLARNLDLPLGDPAAALRIALEGSDRTIDVGWLRVLRDGSVEDDVTSPAERIAPGAQASRDHIFLVIAGVGFDAAMIADTDDNLKARVGWIAYFVSGIRHLHGRRLRVTVRLDGAPPETLRLRSLLVGNCGRLPGGLTLLPDALIDDGWLDVAAIDTRGGVAGWAQLFGEVVLQGVGVRTELPAKIGRIDHTRARTIHARFSSTEPVQVDGDIVGRACDVEARVEEGALVVRVARA
ncbi:diacylglycerol/lipid kinase family protein [Cellulomonas chengniuliangii]|uniref:NAD(+)/NADH kinase n=1 Tax=Cellulomonas chengniuliangii TaxID=2968084 RepID=A0ABY5KZA1_9CELL|nr:diacylglycerol kinase family protein [Cellulomonas chengniuliangii]MCC2307749.1 NAD(+)/NADH kinase [Cellulomonas chengniuliangii]MCC2318860.1 NAD(+)/NADH kinase [Cellulomonas chengniuliangii]UUI75494.1 NAD(+)/NADH kinase [Cellulomonas chengniuliangii]